MAGTAGSGPRPSRRSPVAHPPSLHKSPRLDHRSRPPAAGSPRTDRATRALVAECRAVLAAEVDDLKMKIVPACRRVQLLEIALGLDDVARARQAPPPGEPVDVRVD